MFKLDSVPDHPQKQHDTNLPFDFDVYAKNRYQRCKNTFESKYNESYTQTKLSDLQKELETEKTKYELMFIKIFGSFQKDLSMGLDKSQIKIRQYGRSYFMEENENFLTNSVLQNFYYMLGSKGYPYEIYQEKENVHDAMDGSYVECILVIEIRLK